MSARRVPSLPGFRITLGATVAWTSLLVLLPIAALVFRARQGGAAAFVAAVSTPRALASFRFTLETSLAAALVDVLFGVLVAWVLARYDFVGKRIADAVVDLPLALPTAVAGLALAALYSENGWIGSRLAPLGVKVAFAPAGVVVALAFVGLPFVVRTVQPVVEELDPDVEEAAATLGASPFTTFRRVVFPALVPAVRAGFAAAFARGLGEYGSVLFISGNLPNKTEIASLLVMTRLEQYDYAGATAIGVVMLAAALLLLILIHRLEPASERRHAGV